MVSKRAYKIQRTLIFLIGVVALLYVSMYLINCLQGFRQRGGGDSNTVKIEKFIEKTKKDSPSEVNGVPLVIYRSWITNDIKAEMKATVDKTVSMTPEFDNYFFSDDDCIQFIQENFEPNVAAAFKSLKPGAYQSDLWRYCILYKKGGIYLDIKMELHLPLIDILKEFPKIFIGNIPEEPSNPKNQIWNGLMSSPAGNPVFKACIDEIVESCKNKYYKENYLDITGPCLLWRMNNKFESPTFLSSLPFRFVKGKYEVLFYDKTFIREYSNYRSNQGTQQKTIHYSHLYADRDVYDTSVIFV